MTLYNFIASRNNEVSKLSGMIHWLEDGHTVNPLSTEVK